MHETHSTLVSPGIVQMMQDGGKDVQNVAGLQHEEEELLVVLAELPEEDEELLMKLDFALWMREICVDEGVHQEARDTLQDEGEVLLAVDAAQVVEEEVVGQVGVVAVAGDAAGPRVGGRRRRGGGLLVQADD